MGMAVGRNALPRKRAGPVARAHGKRKQSSAWEEKANFSPLSVQQQALLGQSPPTAPESLDFSAKASYALELPTDDSPPPSQVTMMGGGGEQRPAGSPPDIPSMLLESRICYLGLTIVPQVAELTIAQLLWLGYDNPSKPIYLYINSTGTQTATKRPVGSELDSYAILDTLRYIRPEVQTVCIGKAFGTAAMLLASGTKGRRYSLPHSSIMTTPPRTAREMDTVTNLMVRANELNQVTDTYIDLMTEFTGNSREQMQKDLGRTRYFTPESAMQYGLIDRVIDEQKIESKDYERMLQQAEERSMAAAA